MFGSIADGDDEWKPESFAVSCVQAVEPREVLAAHPVNAHTSCSAVESCVRARSRASLPASSGCALSRPIGRVVLPTRGYCASLARATSFPGPGACVQLSKIIAEARWTPARKFLQACRNALVPALSTNFWKTFNRYIDAGFGLLKPCIAEGRHDASSPPSKRRQGRQPTAQPLARQPVEIPVELAVKDEDIDPIEQIGLSARHANAGR